MFIKDTSFHPEMMKKTVFKITGIFSENAFIYNPSKISHSANIRRFIVCLFVFVVVFCFLLLLLFLFAFLFVCLFVLFVCLFFWFFFLFFF